MQEYIQKVKPLILERIKYQCDELDNPEISQKLYEYTSRGKLLRGVFVCLSAESFGRNIDTEVLDVASALELAQTALLIHDDIMDQDDFRRGKPSMHKIYEQDGYDPQTSTSLAICLGDVVLFHLFSYLNKDLVDLFSKELTKTALGQTFDVSSSKKEISKEDIMYIIQNKTANYTFSLPFQAGLSLSNNLQYKESIVELSRLLGLIFQIRDDELNYQPQTQIGKSSGGDIRENKKTFCRAMLIERCPEIKDFYGQEQYIEYIQELYHNSGVQQIIATQITEYSTLAEGIINQLPIQQEYISIWCQLLEYLQKREF